MRIRYNCWIPHSLFALGVLCLPALAVADDNEGFTEPRYQIQVAAAEMGIINQMLVQEGDLVKAGQVLGVLDDDILKASLAIAKKAKDSQGAIRSAEAEYSLKTDRLKQFKQLRRLNHASAEEVERAEMEKSVAESQLLAANEANQIKELEFHRAEVQLARRKIRSPIQGVVIEVHKDLGEFVSPTDAVVFTVVQLDPLLATFSLPAPEAAQLTKGRLAGVEFQGQRKTNGKIVYVSPVINAQSGTVKVKVEIPNSNGQFRSGQRCQFLLAPIPTQISQRATTSR